MEHTELGRLVALYESGFADIQDILEDCDLTSREKVDAICAIVFADADDEDSDAEDELP